MYVGHVTVIVTPAMNTHMRIHTLRHRERHFIHTAVIMLSLYTASKPSVLQYVLISDVGQMSSEGSRLLQNMEDKAQEKRFVRSVREVHDGLQDIKNILIAQPNITIKEPASTSTPLTGPSQFTRGEPRTLSGRRIASNFSSGRQNTSATKGTSPSPKHPRGAPVPAMRKNIAPVARTPKAASGQPLLLEEEVTRTDTRPFEAFPRTTPRKLQPGKDEVDSGSSSVEAYAHMPATIARERGVQYEETRRKGAGGGSARPPSYGDFGEGYSRSYTTGEAETQTPLARKRDEEVQTAKEERMAPKVLAETHTVAVRAKEPRKPKGEWGVRGQGIALSCIVDCYSLSCVFLLELFVSP